VVASTLAADAAPVGRVTTWSTRIRRSSARESPGVTRALRQLGKQIRLRRAGRELTQEDAAERARLDVRHWQDIEAARRTPTFATLLGIARALSCELVELVAAVRTRDPPGRRCGVAADRRARDENVGSSRRDEW
jgi:ribosome-binding protein aMBF1 (putative translation factor)